MALRRRRERPEPGQSGDAPLRHPLVAGRGTLRLPVAGGPRHPLTSFPELGWDGFELAGSVPMHVPAHFGSSLQHNTHFHVLVPEGLFSAPSPGTQARATFLPLPPPEDEEVESLLCTTAQRVVRLLKRLGRLDEDAYPQDALQVL